MFLLVAKPPRPNEPHWPGRRLLGALDAVLWPALCLGLLISSPGRHGLFGPAAAAGLTVVAAVRVWRAVWMNERYWFTTWWWGKVLMIVIAVGLLLKAAAFVI